MVGLLETYSVPAQQFDCERILPLGTPLAHSSCGVILGGETNGSR